ncbi:hypothetical protein GW17_00029147 [Ensete ventricosum]|nr:hypothetical protein GW17_00029147 [Ensete ventricosum]
MWRNLHANAEDSGDSDELVDPPKVEEKLGAVPSGLSTDAEVAKRYVWESKADGSFAISDDTWNEPLGRGTEISIYFFCMYFVTSSFCVMSSKVSDFESYCPVWAVHTGLPVDQYVDRPLSGGTTDWGCFCPITIRNRLKKENKNLESDCSSPTRSVACGRFLLPAQGEETSPRVGRRNEVTTPKYTARYQHTVPYQAEPGMPVWYEDEETEEDASEKKPKTKTVKETTYDWEDFSEEKPLAWSHFTAEGDVEFKALLFVPPKAPHDLYESYYNTNKSNLKLTKSEVDEYLMQYLMDYEDRKFQNVSKEGLKLGKDSKLKDLKESFKELTNWWKDALSSENVDSVKISNRLDNTPCVVVTSKFGWSANMEKIMQSQTLSDASKQAYMRGKRVLEINPRHPVIKELRDRVAQDSKDESLKHTARLVYQTALMESGFILNDPKEFASSIYKSVQKSLDISPDATVEQEEDVEEAEEEEKGTTSNTESSEIKEDIDEASLKDEL